MDGQRFDRRGSRPRRLGLKSTAALAAVTLLLAACGGDGGNGGNGPTAILHTLIINASEADVTVGFSRDGEPEPDQVVPTCEAALIDYPLADPFQLFIDGETVIDTFEDLPEGLPNDGESDLIVQVNISREGEVTSDNVRPGRGVSKPSKASFCPTLPG